MKGIVFSEFIELVEEKFGFNMADDIIEKCQLSSKGAYTQVGVYDHQELIDLVTKLSEETNISAEDLVKTFGHHLLLKFTKSFPQYFTGINTCFEFFDTIETRVHVEVKKLYPEAELPTFEHSFLNENTMQMIYRSKKPFSALAYGMMMGSADYFNEKITIEMKDLSENGESHVIFNLTKVVG